MKPFMLKRKIKKYRDPLVCSALILAGYIKEDVIPSVPPVFRKTLSDPLRSFGQKKEYNIASFSSRKKSEVMQTLIISPL